MSSAIRTNGERGRQVSAINRDGEASAAALDVADPGSCEAFVHHAVRRFGRLDVLVNNAAVDVIQPVDQITKDSGDRVMDLNGVLSASQAAVRHWLGHRLPGVIVNVCSTEDPTPS